MPSYVDPSKCDGCKGGDKTACMYICPNDLMVLNVKEMITGANEFGRTYRSKIVPFFAPIAFADST